MPPKSRRHFLPAHLRRTSLARREPAPRMHARALQERLETAFRPLAAALCIRPEGMSDDDWEAHSASADDIAGLWAILMGGVLFCAVRDTTAEMESLPTDARADAVALAFAALREADQGVRAALLHLGDLIGAKERVADAEDRRGNPWGVLSAPGEEPARLFFGTQPNVFDHPPVVRRLAPWQPEVTGLGRGMGLAFCVDPRSIGVIPTLVTLDLRDDVLARKWGPVLP